MKILIAMLLLSTQLIAESRVIPLMPPRNFASWKRQPQQNSALMTTQRETPAKPSLLGLEFGTVMKSSATKADIAGMQVLIGGRMFLKLPVSNRFYFRPSAGYFRRGESVGIVTITQHSAEAGALIQYSLTERPSFQWLLGLSQRLEALFSNIGVGTISGGGAPDWIYRLGPNMGFAFAMGENMQLVTDIELGFAVSSPSRIYSGATLGLAFGL